MKKILLSLLLTLTLVSWSSNPSQIVVHHHHYTTYYNSLLREPDSVTWSLTSGMVSLAKVSRKDEFAQDPSIPNSATPKDYDVNGKITDKRLQIDKGHLFNYEDAMGDPIDRVECFYMSNMLPQYHPFNAGDWKELEMQERTWAKTQKLYIVAGGLGTLGKLPAGENIPKFMWKAILMNGKWTVWVMLNSKTSHGHGIAYWQTTLTKFDTQSLSSYVAQNSKYSSL